MSLVDPYEVELSITVWSLKNENIVWQVILLDVSGIITMESFNTTTYTNYSTNGFKTNYLHFKQILPIICHDTHKGMYRIISLKESAPIAIFCLFLVCEIEKKIPHFVNVPTVLDIHLISQTLTIYFKKKRLIKE